MTEKMTEVITYRITARGAAETTATPGNLKPGLKTLLAAIGEQASIASLKARFPKASEDNLIASLVQLVRDGYIESVPHVQAVTADSGTSESATATETLAEFLSQRPKEPTAQQLQRAEVTLTGSGGRHLQPGFQINILLRPEQPITARGGGKHTILIIDGHEAEALAAAGALMKGGFEVRGAATRIEIAQALSKVPLPDLIIMDVDLPDSVGLDVLGKVHEHPEFKATPIVVVTARIEREDIVAALAYGATGYLNKPVRPEALLSHVKDALGMP